MKEFRKLTIVQGVSLGAAMDLASSTSKGESPAPAGPAKGDLASRRIIGAFVTAAGLCLMSLAIVDLCEKRAPAAATAIAWLIVLLIAFAAAAAFRVVNWSRGRRKRYSRSLVISGVVALLAAFVFLWLTVNPANRTPKYDQFAISLGLPAEPAADQAPDRALTRIAAVQAVTASKPSMRQAVLVWWVERAPPTVSAGLLAIFLGGFFISAFGIWFPQVGIDAASSGMGLGEKLIAPLLSLALVGVGASQQIETSRMAKSAELAERGLPTLLVMTPSERKAAADAGRSTGVVKTPDPETVAPETLAMLNEKIETLQLRLLANDLARAHDDAGRQTLAALDGRLREITTVLRRPTPQPALTPVDVEVFRTSLGGINTSMDASKIRLDDASRASCMLLKVEGEALGSRAAKLEETATEKDVARARALDRHKIWRLWPVAIPPAGDEDRKSAASLREAADKAEREQGVLCPRADAQTASR